jgi:hypothetical protein
MEPALPEEAITRERLSLEDAIRKVELENAGGEVDAAKAEQASDAAITSPPAKVEPVSISGAKTVHDAATAAEALGGATAETKRAAAEALNSTTPEPVAAPDRVEPAVEAPLRAPIIASVVEAARGPSTPTASATTEPSDPIRPRISAIGAEDAIEPPRKGRGWIVVTLVAVVLLGGGSAAGWYFANMGPKSEAPRIAEPAPTPVTPPVPATERPKNDDRVGGDSPRVATDGPSPSANPAPVTAPPPVVAAPPPQSSPTPSTVAPPAGQAGLPIPIAQRAALFQETPGSDSGNLLTGTVVWRTQTVSVGPGQPPDLALIGDIQVPERRLAATITIRRNLDQTLPASHTIEVFFVLPRDFVYGGVAEMPGVLMKSAEQARGVPLIGQAVRITNGFFFVGLSSFESDRTTNVQALRQRTFIDLPIRFDNGRRAILTLEKGAIGERSFDEALTAWGQ